MTKLTLDQWTEQFRPVPNHLTTDTGVDFGNGSCLFETFGHDLDYIQSLDRQGSRRIWTLIESDGEQFIGEGFHLVNRIGYLVTEKPYDPDQQYEIDSSEFEQDRFTITIKTFEGLSQADKDRLIDVIEAALPPVIEAMEEAGESVQTWSIEGPNPE